MTTLCHHCQRPIVRVGPIERPARLHPAVPAEANTDRAQLAALGAHLERQRRALRTLDTGGRED